MSTQRKFNAFSSLAVVASMVLGGGIGGGGGPRSGGFGPHRRVSQRSLFEARTLDASDTNPRHPTWGAAGTPYARVAPANYADKVGSMVGGPNARMISNRIFNDDGVNLFSERGLSQWVWAWGQFLDHDLGLRDETPGESAPISFNAADPLEQFTNDFGAVAFSRTPAAPGTGTSAANPRQQINTLTSLIDASNVYGTTSSRLEWLLNGPVDGTLSDNKATLMLPGGYLPRADARGNASTAPPVDLMGALMGTPSRAAVAGDVRANENIALTAIQTLFAREHNRIVALLPSVLSDTQKFEIARRVVGDEIQRITYEEFLPALGIKLSRYRGFDPNVNPSITDEFATVAFRAHSMVHGEFEVDFTPGRYKAAQLTGFQSSGIEVVDEPTDHALVVPLTVAFGNPDLLESLGLGPVLASLANERQYRNDEQIDNSMRSVLFEVPKPGTTDPTACQTPVVDPTCFSGVVDLGALDVMRGRDHGMPTYNDLRKAYGLAPKTSFTAITAESTDAFPSDPLIDAADPIDDPNIMDFTQLRDANGVVLDPNDPATQENAVTGVRRSTLAARLKAIYGTTNTVDAFVGLVSEPHAPGTELGELELAIMKKQFEALRDGDRFFYANDPVLAAIQRTYHLRLPTLSQIVDANSDAAVGAAPFAAAG
jgi:Animal haem peroxidase